MQPFADRVQADFVKLAKEVETPKDSEGQKAQTQSTKPIDPKNIPRDTGFAFKMCEYVCDDIRKYGWGIYTDEPGDMPRYETLVRMVALSSLMTRAKDLKFDISAFVALGNFRRQMAIAAGRCIIPKVTDDYVGRHIVIGEAETANIIKEARNDDLIKTLNKLYHAHTSPWEAEYMQMDFYNVNFFWIAKVTNPETAPREFLLSNRGDKHAEHYGRLKKTDGTENSFNRGIDARQENLNIIVRGKVCAWLGNITFYEFGYGALQSVEVEEPGKFHFTDAKNEKYTITVQFHATHGHTESASIAQAI